MSDKYNKYVLKTLTGSLEAANERVDAGEFSRPKNQVALKLIDYYKEHLEKNIPLLNESGGVSYMTPKDADNLDKMLDILSKLSDKEVRQVIELQKRVVSSVPKIRKNFHGVCKGVEKLVGGFTGTTVERDEQGNVKVQKVRPVHRQISLIKKITQALHNAREAVNKWPPLFKKIFGARFGILSLVTSGIGLLLDVNQFIAKIFHINVVGICDFVAHRFQVHLQPNSSHAQVAEGLQNTHKNLSDLRGEIMYTFEPLEHFSDKLSAEQVKLYTQMVAAEGCGVNSFECSSTSTLTDIQIEAIERQLAGQGFYRDATTGQYPPEAETLRSRLEQQKLAENRFAFTDKIAKLSSEAIGSKALKLYDAVSMMKMNKKKLHGAVSMMNENENENIIDVLNMQIAASGGGDANEVQQRFNKGYKNGGHSMYSSFIQLMPPLKTLSNGVFYPVNEVYPAKQDLRYTKPVQKHLCDRKHAPSNEELRKSAMLVHGINSLVELNERPGSTETNHINPSLTPVAENLWAALAIGSKFIGAIVACTVAMSVVSLPMLPAAGITLATLALSKPISKMKVFDFLKPSENGIVKFIAGIDLFKTGKVGEKALEFTKRGVSNVDAMQSVLGEVLLPLFSDADVIARSPESDSRNQLLVEKGIAILQAYHQFLDLAKSSPSAVIGGWFYKYLERMELGGVTTKKDYYRVSEVSDILTKRLSDVFGRDTTGRYPAPPDENPTNIFSYKHPSYGKPAQEKVLNGSELDFYKNHETGNPMTASQFLNGEVESFYALVLDRFKVEKILQDPEKLKCFQQKVTEWQDLKKDDKDDKDHKKKLTEVLKDIVVFDGDPDQGGKPAMSARFAEKNDTPNRDKSLAWFREEYNLLQMLDPRLVGDGDPSRSYLLTRPDLKPENSHVVSMQARAPSPTGVDNANEIPKFVDCHGYKKPIIMGDDVSYLMMKHNPDLESSAKHIALGFTGVDSLTGKLIDPEACDRSADIEREMKLWLTLKATKLKESQVHKSDIGPILAVVIAFNTENAKYLEAIPEKFRRHDKKPEPPRGFFQKLWRWFTCADHEEIEQSQLYIYQGAVEQESYGICQHTGNKGNAMGDIKIFYGKPYRDDRKHGIGGRNEIANFRRPDRPEEPVYDVREAIKNKLTPMRSSMESFFPKAGSSANESSQYITSMSPEDDSSHQHTMPTGSEGDPLMEEFNQKALQMRINQQKQELTPVA